MTDIKLIRHGQKTDWGMYNLYVEHGMDPSPALYDVTEEVTWRQVDDDAAVDLATYGISGRWTLWSATEQLMSLSGQMYGLDVYQFPLVDGATAYDAPHVRAEGEV
jgi:hypothetical protein